MQFPDEVSNDVMTRLARIEGQVRGVQRLIGEHAECRDIVTQLSAVSGALDRVGFKLMVAALASPEGQANRDELEKLFLKLS